MEGIPCPVHGKNMEWLATANEWEYYCEYCDLRYNRKGEPKPPDGEPPAGHLSRDGLRT